jgi:Nucleotidyl transferase AbiEii toxin, Type IV TA system
MPLSFDPQLAVLPSAQKELWPQLAAARTLSFVLYGGTAVALYLGHRISLDFDFFCAEPLDKMRLTAEFGFLSDAETIQEDPQTLVVAVNVGDGSVKVSFFGTINIGHANPPLLTADGVLLVASLEDLMATKLKAILDRVEAKDYADIAAMLAAGVSLERGLAACRAMYGKDAALALRTLGYFKGGDLESLPQKDRKVLQTARDRVTEIPEMLLLPGLV